MSKKIFVFALGAIFLALSFASEAQQPRRIPRIGILFELIRRLSSQSARIEAFPPAAAASLGYVEDENIRHSSTDMPREIPIACLTLQPNWSVSKSTSSSPVVRDNCSC